MPASPGSDSLAAFLSARREQQVAAVRGLEAALKDGTDRDIVEAAELVRSLGAVAPTIRWEAVYVIEERSRDVEAFRTALAGADDQALVEAWSSVRGRWEEFLTAEERAAGLAAFQRWGRRLRNTDAEGARPAHDARS
jgi:hypothetical protein